MKVKFNLPIAAVSVLSATLCAQDSTETWQPVSFPESRYEEAWARNPFNLKTTPEEGETQSFAKDYALAGVSVIGEKKRVLLVNRKTKQFESVNNSSPSNEGFELVSIALDSDRTKVTAVIKKGGKEATVKFDSALNSSIAKEQMADRDAANLEKENDKNPDALSRTRGGSRVRTPLDLAREREARQNLPDLKNVNPQPPVENQLTVEPQGSPDLNNAEQRIQSSRMLRTVPGRPTR